MSITFTGTTDNSNFDYIANQTTPNYRVIGTPPTSGQTLRTKENQKVLFKDEVIVTTPEGGDTNSPGIDTRFGKNSEIVFDGCNILINPAFKQRRVTEGNVKFINTNVMVLPDNNRINFTADKIEGMHLNVRRRSPREQVFLYVNQNSVIKGLPGKPNMFEGMWCIELAKGVSIKDTTFKNTGPNLLNWSAGKISVRGLTLYDGTPKENSVDCDAWINGNNIILFYSCKLRLNHVTGGADGRACRFICINENYNVKTLKIRYEMQEAIPSGSQSFVSQATTGDHVTPESVFTNQFLTVENYKLKKDGKEIPYIDLLTEVTTDVRLNQPTGMFDPTAVVLPNTHQIFWSRTIRHPTIKTYMDTIGNQTEDIGATLGTPTVAVPLNINMDNWYHSGLTNSGTCTFNLYTDGTITNLIRVVVNDPMTPQDIYNKWKEFLYTDAGFSIQENLIEAEDGKLKISGKIDFNADITAPTSDLHLREIIVQHGIVNIKPNVTVAVPYSDINNVGSLEIRGVKGHTVRIKKVSDRSVILETPVQKKNNVVINLTNAMIAEPIYITKVATDGLTQAGTSAIQLVRGVNDPVQLYSGEQVQITNIDDLSKIKKGLTQINGGVKKASLLIPYTDDLNMNS